MVDQPVNEENNAGATFNWPPLESNPEIFSDYMRRAGLPDQWTFGEIYGFDEDLLNLVPKPCLAVIVNAEFLQAETDRTRGDPSLASDFYMQQTGALDNACGVIACLHAILNNLGDSDDKIRLAANQTLSNFHQRTQGMTALERALALESFAEFQEVHHEFAALGDSAQCEAQDDVKHHFTAFVVNSAGQLVEFDGLKQGPHVIAENCTDLLRGAVAEIQRRLADGEISESLSMITLNGLSAAE